MVGEKLIKEEEQGTKYSRFPYCSHISAENLNVTARDVNVAFPYNCSHYMGTIWEQYGNNIGIILAAECSLHWQSIICTITSSSLRQSRLCYRKYVPSEKYGNNMGTI